MAAPTIEQVMLGLETRLATISGLQTTPVGPAQITPPCAIVGIPDIPEYHTTFGPGFFTVDPTITLLVSKAVNREGQLKLAGYANPTGALSVRVAVEGDQTLGGIVSQAFISAFRVLGDEEVGALGFWGGLFVVTVVAPSA